MQGGLSWGVQLRGSAVAGRGLARRTPGRAKARAPSRQKALWPARGVSCFCFLFLFLSGFVFVFCVFVFLRGGSKNHEFDELLMIFDDFDDFVVVAFR